MEVLQRYLPAVELHLRTLNCPVSVVSIQWFMCLFAKDLPVSLTMRVWDVLFVCADARNPHAPLKTLLSGEIFRRISLHTTHSQVWGYCDFRCGTLNDANGRTALAELYNHGITIRSAQDAWGWHSLARFRGCAQAVAYYDARLSPTPFRQVLVSPPLLTTTAMRTC